MIAMPVEANDEFIGVWQGEAVETGSSAPYPMTLSIYVKNGRIFQHSTYGPPLNCAGGGVLIEKMTGGLHLSEVIVENRDMCADGTIRVYADGKRTLIWEWFYPDGKFAAQANLTIQSD